MSHREEDLERIGYWKGYYDPNLPDPRDFVDEDWDPAERQMVIRHLQAGEKQAQWRGLSSCRFCQCSNGSACLTDGTYMWPAGLAHYLQYHNVRLPQAFVDHVRASG